MPQAHRWRFGPYVADLQERQLHRFDEGGAPVLVPVTRKAFQLLAELLARPGKLVGKAQLFDTVWAGTVVSDAALSRAIRELRVALQDDAAAPRYIATAHGLGFRFVAAVQPLDGTPQADPGPTTPAFASAGAGSPMAPALPAPAAPPVGRDAELAELGAALQAAGQGQRQLLLISGAPGIGKTTLAEHFITTQADGVLVARGRCIEQYGTAEPYLPLLEALESLARPLGAARLRDDLLRYAPAWLAQLPWLAHDADPAALQRALAGASTQRMLRELAQWLESLAAERPLLLWLEDLHWSDPSTLDLLAYLLGRHGPARLMVMGSLRPADAAGDRPLNTWLLRLRQLGQVRLMPLALLPPQAAVDWLRLRLGDSPGLPLASLGHFVHRRTDGNPLFMRAVLDDLVQQGQLVARSSTDRAAGSSEVIRWELRGAVDELGTALPDTLRQLLRHQLERLGDERSLVEAAAVAGPEFSAAAVAAALELPLVEAESRCQRLAEAGAFLRPGAPATWPDGTTAAGFGFVHALYWQGAYEGAAPARRVQWQRRIADRQLAAWGAASGQIAAELAMRYEAARDVPRCLQHLERAGAAALSRCAYAECAELLRHGLELARELPEDERELAELSLRLPLGAALMALHGYAAPQVESSYRRALDLARYCGRDEHIERALRGLWNVALVRAELDRARVSADELTVRAAAQGDLAATFDAFAKQGQTSLHRGEFTSARAQLEHALRLPLAAHEPVRVRELPRVAAYLSWVLWYMGQAEGSRTFAAQALVLAAEAGSAHTSAFVLGFSGWVHLFLGESAPARALGQQQEALAQEHGLAYWHAWGRMLQGLADAQDGAGATACERAREAIDAFEAMGARVGVSHFLCSLAEAELACGLDELARRSLQRSSALLQACGNAYHAAETERVWARLESRAGAVQAAERHLAEARRIARRQQATALLARLDAAAAAAG